jgi:hypothetical protein
MLTLLLFESELSQFVGGYKDKVLWLIEENYLRLTSYSYLNLGFMGMESVFISSWLKCYLSAWDKTMEPKIRFHQLF